MKRQTTFKMGAEMNNAETEKIHAEIAKLMAETAKINKETIFYPIAVSSALVSSVAAITTLIIKLV